MFKQIAFAAALGVVASASAADWEPSFYPSNYIGGDVGSTRFSGQSARHNSYGVYVGYEFVPNFAVEIGARRLADIDLCCHHLLFDQAAVSLVGAVPLGDFNIFSRIGFNKLKVSSQPPHVPTETSSGALAGVGVGYTFSPTVSARVEIQKPSNDISNVSFGVSIRY